MGCRSRLGRLPLRTRFPHEGFSLKAAARGEREKKCFLSTGVFYGSLLELASNSWKNCLCVFVSLGDFNLTHETILHILFPRWLLEKPAGFLQRPLGKRTSALIISGYHWRALTEVRMWFLNATLVAVNRVGPMPNTWQHMASRLVFSPTAFVERINTELMRNPHAFVLFIQWQLLFTRWAASRCIYKLWKNCNILTLADPWLMLLARTSH